MKLRKKIKKLWKLCDTDESQKQFIRNIVNNPDGTDYLLGLDIAGKEWLKNKGCKIS